MKMTQNQTITKMIWSFWILYNHFIKCLVISQYDLFKNITVHIRYISNTVINNHNILKLYHFTKNKSWACTISLFICNLGANCIIYPCDIIMKAILGSLWHLLIVWCHLCVTNPSPEGFTSCGLVFHWCWCFISLMPPPQCRLYCKRVNEIIHVVIKKNIYIYTAKYIIFFYYYYFIRHHTVFI